MSPIWFKRLRYRLRKGRWPEPERMRAWRAAAAFERAVSRLAPGDAAIDGGANKGAFTERMAASGATVHAFEPDPHCVALLRARFAGRSTVTLHEAALGAEAGAATLYRAAGFEADPDLMSESSTVFAEKRGVDPASARSVPQVDLPAFVAALGRVALLKLDVEGAEIPILEALLDQGLLGCIDAVFVETHENKIPGHASRLAEIRRRLAEDGHTHVSLDWR